MKFVLCALSVVLCNEDKYWDDSPGFLKRSHSLIPPHSGNLPLWELKGDTMATSEYIRLTSDQQSKNGGLWSRVVCNQKKTLRKLFFLVDKCIYSHVFTFKQTKIKVYFHLFFGAIFLFKILMTEKPTFLIQINKIDSINLNNSGDVFEKKYLQIMLCQSWYLVA